MISRRFVSRENAKSERSRVKRSDRRGDREFEESQLGYFERELDENGEFGGNSVKNDEQPPNSISGFLILT